jgi:glycosyltransferase involved in cell wall biosynthesis
VKIAIVDPAAYSLPYDVALCEALADRGHEVTLYTTTFAHGPMPEAHGFQIVEWFYQKNPMRLAALGAKVRRALRAMQHPKNLRRLLRTLNARHVDIVHVQWLVAPRYDAAAYGRLVDAPTVLTVHNATPRKDAAPLNAEYLREFSALIAHSDAGARNLESVVVGDGNLITRIPHGAFDMYRSARNPIEDPIDMDPDAPTVVLAGLLRPYKGVDVLLRAWPSVLEHVPNAQLAIAGRPMGIELPNPLPSRVYTLPRFLDEREFAWLLHRADVVCLPYTSIDLSGVLFGALALGRPMVLSNVGGFAEFEGHGAVLVPPGDSDAVADALVAVLTDRELRERLAAESAAAADADYSWERIAEMHEQLYERLLPVQ